VVWKSSASAGEGREASREEGIRDCGAAPLYPWGRSSSLEHKRSKGVCICIKNSDRARRSRSGKITQNTGKLKKCSQG